MLVTVDENRGILFASTESPIGKFFVHQYQIRSPVNNSVKSNKFPLFSSTVTNLLYENAYLEINRLYMAV